MDVLIDSRFEGANDLKSQDSRFPWCNHSNAASNILDVSSESLDSNLRILYCKRVLGVFLSFTNT
jgi:hypothetical protein